MKHGKKIVGLFLSCAMALGTITPAFAEENPTAKAGTAEKVDDIWYYYSQNDAEYIFEKVSHPDRGAGEVDGFLDTEDARSQSYSWSAIESGDYIYVGTCYNSTYGIYWRNVFQMMLGAGKTQAEAMQIARDFVQFVFDERFDETLQPKGVVVKFHKETGEFSLVYDSKTSSDAAIASTSCSGYRMAFEFKNKLYFVSLANPTMFLLEIDPENNGETETCEIAFKRSLSAEGSKKQIAAGVHGLIVYDDEILMCLADEESSASKWLDGEAYPEGGLIIASKDARNWRVIADENDLGPSAYHNYDGLMGGGIWDIIEYNGHVYVTVVTDLTDTSTGVVNKQGFAMYRGTKEADGNFIWEMMVGDTSKDGVKYPYGLGTSYAMACNMWVYDGHLYLGTYNDPMLDLTAVADRADFEPLYWDLYYSINLYRMDESENIALVGGKSNDVFTKVIGNMGTGLGDNANQYVWRMVEHDNKLFLATYDTSTLTSAFTQLTDGQLVGMSKEEYLTRLGQIEKFMTSLGLLQEEYKEVFNKVFGNDLTRNLFDAAERFIDAATGEKDPVPEYLAFVEAYNAFKDQVTNAKVPGYLKPVYNALVKELDKTIFGPQDKILEELKSTIFYYGCSYYMQEATQGFDLLVTEDGFNFEVITNDGFGDPSNHGVRTLTSADEGETLYVGTANPFYGGQMWKVVTEVPSEPEEPEEVVPEVPTSEEIDALEIPVEVNCEDNAEHKTEAVLSSENVTAGNVTKAESGEYMVTLTVNGKAYIDAFNAEYEAAATHSVVGSETAMVVLTWDAEAKAWEKEADEKVIYNMKEEVSQAAEYTVTFEAGEQGAFAENVVAQVAVNAGDTVGETNIPAVNVNDGYEFAGWKQSEEEAILSNAQVAAYVVNADVTFTAVYNEVKVETETIVVEFSAGANGTFADDEVTSYEVEVGTGVPDVPSVNVNAGYKFAGWKVQNDSNLYSADQIKAMTFDANMVITASYKAETTTPDIQETFYDVIFKAGDHGTLVGEDQFEVKEGTSLITIPAVNVEDGYVFAGWENDGVVYNNEAVKAMVITGDATFIAQYEKDGKVLGGADNETSGDDESGNDGVISGDSDVKDDGSKDTSSEETVDSKVDTGDSAPVMVYVGVMAGMVLVCGGVFIIRRKKNRC